MDADVPTDRDGWEALMMEQAVHSHVGIVNFQSMADVGIITTVQVPKFAVGIIPGVAGVALLQI